MVVHGGRACLPSPRRRSENVLRDGTAIRFLEEMRAFVVDQPTCEPLEAYVVEPTDELHSNLPRTSLKLPAQFAIGIGKEVAPIALQLDVLRRRVNRLTGSGRAGKRRHERVVCAHRRRPSRQFFLVLIQKTVNGYVPQRI